MAHFIWAQSTTVLVVAVPAIYLLLVALGRWLKRRAGVRLGVFYQLFCIVVAVFVPLTIRFAEVNFIVLQFLGAAVVMLGTVFLLALIRRFFWEYYLEERRRVQAPKFMHDALALLLFVVALLLVLTFIFEIKIPGLLAGSGILAVVLGFAMQDMLGNIIGGFALHFGKSIRPGDWLMVDNRHAEVMEVNWRSTRLRTNDNIYLDIPNSQISKSIIVNLTRPERLHAMRLSVGIDYRVPPNDVKDLLLRATQRAEGLCTERRSKVYLSQFGESAITYEIKFWMEDHSRFNEIMDAIRTNIWYELKRNGIKVPFPIRTLHIESAPAHDAQPDGEAVRQTLRQQPLFQCLDDGQRDKLVARARQYRCGRGEKIIEQGTQGESMFILMRGEASVCIGDNGEMTRVASLRPGECFGEMSLLTGARRSATVVAQTDCDVVEIEKANLLDLLQRHPELLREFSELLARRQLETDGVLAQTGERHRATELQRKCADGFFARLSSFFEL